MKLKINGVIAEHHKLLFECNVLIALSDRSLIDKLITQIFIVAPPHTSTGSAVLTTCTAKQECIAFTVS